MRARKKEGAVWSRDGLNRYGDGRRDGQTGENEPRRRAQETTIVATAKGGRTEEPAGKEESTQEQETAGKEMAEERIRFRHGGGLYQRKQLTKH